MGVPQPSSLVLLLLILLLALPPPAAGPRLPPSLLPLLLPPSRGLHSSTFWLNVSALFGIGGAIWSCLGGV